jgi:hypothetical protein
MFETKPRRIASSAISRWLQWLIGRSLSNGFSQVIAITAQICSGVYVAGAPERGASASRSGTDWAGGACRHRPRQYRTVFGHTSSSRALSRTPTSSAACNIMRIRNANCCDVEWARSSASSASRCAGSTITGSAANRGIATSRLSFRLVMPHRRRFDSALCRKAASFRLPSYLHASRSRDFRSAVLVHPSGIEGLIFGSWAMLSGERLSCIGPAEGLGHGGVEISDELLDPGLQHLFAGEVAAADELSYQNGKPDFDLIEP